MSLGDITSARRASTRARARFFSTLTATQARLRPANLAGEAWDGVKAKSAGVAGDAIEAAKDRPVAVGATLGAIALYLARKPLWRAAMQLVSRDEDDGIEKSDAELSRQDGARAPETQGVE